MRSLGRLRLLIQFWPLLAPIAAALAALTLLLVTTIVVMFILTGGSSAASGCKTEEVTVGDVKPGQVPKELIPIYRSAATKYKLGEEGPAWLAAINSVETDFGKNMSVSTAGAQGWMQFMPATWTTYGVDANGDGTKDPKNPNDAIYAAANYLKASGAPKDWHRAVFAYNHADWYVKMVEDKKNTYLKVGGATDSQTSQPGAPSTVGACSADSPTSGMPGDIHQVTGDPSIWNVPIPGFPGETCDQRILPDLLYLVKRYKLSVTDCFSRDGVHAVNGEHPLGVGVDLGVGKGGSWALVDELAAWAEPSQNSPRPPFKWVGYNGDSNHGTGNHLHLSWDHAPAQPFTRAAWVKVFTQTNE